MRSEGTITKAVGKAENPPATQSWGSDRAASGLMLQNARTILIPVSKPQKEVAQIGATATMGAPKKKKLCWK